MLGNHTERSKGLHDEAGQQYLVVRKKMGCWDLSACSLNKADEALLGKLPEAPVNL